VVVGDSVILRRNHPCVYRGFYRDVVKEMTPPLTFRPINQWSKDQRGAAAEMRKRKAAGEPWRFGAAKRYTERKNANFELAVKQSMHAVGLKDKYKSVASMFRNERSSAVDMARDAYQQADYSRRATEAQARAFGRMAAKMLKARK